MQVIIVKFIHKATVSINRLLMINAAQNSWLEFLEFPNNRCVIVSDISLSWQWVTRQPSASFQDLTPVIRQAPA